MVHIPSTQSLRVFRKAAETLSFTQTAEALYLTQSAVSHQVKQLEEQLRASLFVRHRRGIVLSGTGRRFLQAITPILNELESAVLALQEGGMRADIKVFVESTLLVSGLLPKLSEILDLIPDLRLHLVAADGQPKGLAEDRCIAIYLGREITEPETYCGPIASEECFAVCAPTVLARHPVRTLADLKHHRLLLARNEDNGADLDWESWLPPEERDVLVAAPHAIFSTRALALEAALVGQGIALTGSVPAKPHLVSGRLVRPLDRRITCSGAYYFACAEKLLGLPSVRLLRDWFAQSWSSRIVKAERNGRTAWRHVELEIAGHDYDS